MINWEKINWEKIVNEIQAAGWTQLKITEETGVSQTVISRLKRGEQTDVYWHAGDALLKLHKKVA